MPRKDEIIQIGNIIIIRSKHRPRGRAAAMVGDLDYAAGEVGDVSPEEIMVTFNRDVNSPGANYLAGVTIKINAIAETFETGVRQTDNSMVLYGNSTDFADANDLVTWEYDDDFGDIEDSEGNPLGDVVAQSVVNNVGSHFYFDNNEEGIWLAVVT